METQAWILRSFLAQLERQEVVDEQAANGFAGEFTRLKSQSTKYRMDRTYPTRTAEKQENIKKNRYKDIVPFDHTRVKLTLTTAKSDTEYINASFIKGASGSRAYIATQGPLPHTVLDFLRMLWEYDVKVVIMACREFEMGKKKCERYWPQKQEQPFVFEPFTVYCDSEESKGDYLTRTLRVTYRNCSRTLKQLHYYNWPDHGVPDSIPPILDMLHEMRSYQAHDDVPFCIHCSAGCGRTGVLCVIDYTWNLLKKQMITPEFNIYDLVHSMRTQRPSVVQTKEQYELVYRAIKLLFERYLHSVDAQICRNEVPSAITPDPESEHSDPDEELDLLPQFQHLLDEERVVSPETPSPSASVNHIASRAVDMQREQDQWQLLRTLSETLAVTQAPQAGPKTSVTPEHADRRAAAGEERIQDRDEVPLLNSPPSPAVAAAICLMVEDPYFDMPMSSPSTAELTECVQRWTSGPVFTAPSLCLNDETLEPNPPASGTAEVNRDEEAPPPLPQRTPESYVLAAEDPDPHERLKVIIPPNAAAEAVRELASNPPSPVPPLPERTPESFQFSLDQAPVEQRSEVKLSRIGTSSEWSGDSKASQNETKPWLRSKSLKATMTFTVASPVPVKHPDPASNTASNSPGPHVDPATPPLPPQSELTTLDEVTSGERCTKDDTFVAGLIVSAEESLTPPLPDRTPESFLLPTDQSEYITSSSQQRRSSPTGHQEPGHGRPPPSETTRHSPRVGLSAEWDGTAQPRKFLDVVMCRSKSVRAKSSRQEPLSAARQLAQPPVVVAGTGSALLNSETSGNQSDRSNEKGMTRTKSLFFRHKQKRKTAPPPLPTQPGPPAPPYGASSSGFKLGFGNRLGKPKGPRSYPESWV